jgi:hypothetical protein
MIFSIGIMYLILVHPVPALVAVFISFLCFPPLDNILLLKFNFRIPLLAKIILAVFIIWFTLGVSDLGDMLDNWLK